MPAPNVTSASILKKLISRNNTHSGRKARESGHWTVSVARTAGTEKSHARIRPVRTALSPHTTEVALPARITQAIRPPLAPLALRITVPAYFGQNDLGKP